MGLRSSIACYNNCCFCCIPLKVGTIILGILGVLGGGGQAIRAIINIGQISGAFGYSQVIINILYFVVCAVVIFGAIKENQNFLIPYLVVAGIYVVVIFIFAILTFVGGAAVAGTAASEGHDEAATGVAVVGVTFGVIFVIIGLICTHFWLVVYAFFEELRDGGENQGKIYSGGVRA